MNKEQTQDAVGSSHYLQPFNEATFQAEQKSLKRSYDEMSGMYMGIYHQGNIMHPMTSSNRMFYRQPYTPQHNVHLFHSQMNHPGLMGQNHFIPQHAKQHIIVQEPVFPKFPPQNFDIPDISSSNSVYGDSAYGGSPLSPSTALANQTSTSRQSSYACISAPSSEVPSSIESQPDSHPPVNAQFPQQRWSVQAPAGGSNDSSPVSQSEDNSANFDSNLPFISAQTQPVTLQQNVKVTSGFEATNKPGLPPKKTRSPKKRKRKDPNEPQKPVSAYSLFFRNAQAAIKSQNPSATFGDVSKIVAAMWDNLADDIKNYYKRQMEMAKKEYLKQLAIYRSSLASKESQGTTNSNEATASQEGGSEDKTSEEISSSSLSQDQNVSTTTTCLPPAQLEAEQQQNSPAQLSPGQHASQQPPLVAMAKNFQLSAEVASGRYMMMNQYPHFNQQMPYVHPMSHHHQVVQTSHDDHILMCNIMPSYNQMSRMDEVISQPQSMYPNFSYSTEGYDFVPLETFSRNIEANSELDEALKIT